MVLGRARGSDWSVVLSSYLPTLRQDTSGQTVHTPVSYGVRRIVNIASLQKKTVS